MRTDKIISMSLYGDKDLYLKGAIENVKCWREIYPEWKLRIYYDKSERALLPVLAELAQAGVDLRGANNLGGISGMFWRFLAASDPLASHVLVRDIDSRLNVRERAAVDAWIDSGRDGHVIRDHEQHGVIMLGGTWGIRGGLIPDMEAKIARWGQWQKHRDDQDFLAWNVWPHIRSSCLQHGYKGEPFPPHAPYDGYVGEPIAPAI